MSHSAMALSHYARVFTTFLTWKQFFLQWLISAKCSINLLVLSPSSVFSRYFPVLLLLFLLFSEPRCFRQSSTAPCTSRCVFSPIHIIVTLINLFSHLNTSRGACVKVPPPTSHVAINFIIYFKENNFLIWESSSIDQCLARYHCLDFFAWIYIVPLKHYQLKMLKKTTY